MLNSEKKTGFFIIGCILFFFIYNIFSNTFEQVIVHYGLVYWIFFYIPKIIPLLVFGLYLLVKDSHFYLKTQNSSLIFGITAFLFLVMSLVAFFVSGSITDSRIVIGQYYSWSWAAILSWLSVFCLSFVTVNKKVKDSTFSLVYSVLLVSAASMLYEIPVYFKFVLGAYLDFSYPFFVGTQFFSLAFLLYLTYRLEWRPEKYFVVSLTLFVVHSFFWWFNKDFLLESGLIQHVWAWLPRFIGASVLMSMIYGIKNRVKT